MPLALWQDKMEFTGTFHEDKMSEGSISVFKSLVFRVLLQITSGNVLLMFRKKCVANFDSKY